MKKKKFLKRAVFVLLVGLSLNQPLLAQSLEQKIKTLEKKVSDLEVKEAEAKGRVGTFLAEKISLGGFFEHAVTGNFHPTQGYQFSANSHIFAVNLGVKLNEQFRFVSQELVVLAFPLQNEHNANTRGFSNTATVAALIAHAYGEYAQSEKFKIQTGLGWVPFGIMNQNREFPTLLRRRGPQIVSNQ